MGTYLCPHCGSKLDDTMKTCPTCGAVNQNNPEIFRETVKQIEKTENTNAKFNICFSLVTLVVGIIIFVSSMKLLISDVSKYVELYVYGGSFVSAVASAFVVIFSLMEMCKHKGNTIKPIVISGLIALSSLLDALYMSNIF